ncbi:hypothetical protein [Streptomyces sp. bgisy034]|uniref:hypothetical protein n=1 Tax=Streptomyces sp. bgisy034 TaxID=3413774 RepID=UPI003EB9BC6B
MSTRYERGQAATNAQVKRMLIDMAVRLEARRPDQPLTPVARVAVIQATTMDPVLGRALRARCPEITSPVTRSAYAARLRQAAELLDDPGRRRPRAERVAELHAECDGDYAEGLKHLDLNGHRSADLLADASEAAEDRATRDV